MKVNLHTSHPSAFISSTFNDLREERQLVADTLRESGLNVNALDVKPASTTSSKKEILNGIQESDFVILLVGNRYGSILPKMTRSTSKSITWWEYETACRMRKPVIAFFKNITNFKASDDDDFNDLKYQRKGFSLKNLKRKLQVRIIQHILQIPLIYQRKCGMLWSRLTDRELCHCLNRILHCIQKMQI